VRSDDPWRFEEGLHFSAIEAATYPLYLAEIEREAARAWRTYGLLVVPGLELTFNDPEPVMGAHAVAIGLREFVPVDEASRTRCERRPRQAPRSSRRIRVLRKTGDPLAGSPRSRKDRKGDPRCEIASRPRRSRCAGA
jgi:hypothetical protein